MEELYKQAIMRAVDECNDLELLDLVWKLLDDAAPNTPDPVEPITLEVKCNANYSRNQRQRRDVPLCVLRSAEHPKKNTGKMGAWRAELPGVCGGADSLQSAA